MTGFKKFIALATVAIVALALAACSSEMTDAEIEEAARGMGMMTQAEANAMAGDATMTDAEIQEAARGMGMMTTEEGLAMASEMGLTISGNRLQQVQERGHRNLRQPQRRAWLRLSGRFRQQRRLRH